jgi:3-hydroxymyristoyl/3-hydroxydecanoyl-(acyl carrier protein) dehydratase
MTATGHTGGATAADHQPPPRAPTFDEDAGLEFDGVPFDPLLWSDPAPAAPAAPAVPAAPAAPAAAGGHGAAGASAAVARAAREIGAALAAAHDSALLAQAALQGRLLTEFAARPTGPAVPEAAALVAGAAVAPVPAGPGRFEVAGTRARAVEQLSPPAAPRPVTTEAAFKPLARTSVRDLDGTALARLAAGDVAGVFGAAYDQDGVNPLVRLAPDEPLLLAAVHDLDPRGGRRRLGGLRARLAGADRPHGTGGDVGALVAASAQAAQVLALRLGLHLCLADSAFARLGPAGPDDGAEVEIIHPLTGPGQLPGPAEVEVEIEVEVTAVDLVPRPWLRVDAVLHSGGEVVGRVRGVSVGVAERPGSPVGAELGGRPSTWLGRRNRFGDRAVLSEFHMAHFCRGDQSITLGPEFARYTGRKATRLPDGGLLLVDRVMSVEAERGVLAGGAAHVTEYDAAAESWYFGDTANASMPNCVYMETSLQAALMIGYYVGPTLLEPDAVVSLRNLGGTATVLREVDLRGATIRQHSELLSTTIMPGSSLQNFSYTLATDGEPFYEGETLFGYFSDSALANQTGLDGGRSVPTWLDAQAPRPATRVIDVAARRADPAARLCSRDHLALLDAVTVVDGGGTHGQGYLHSERAIDPADWYFDRHFVFDPVIPGSLGVESVVQALQEWLLDAGYADGLTDPGFILPVGVPFTWKYRGQFLPTDGACTLEAHIREVARRPGRVRLTADASMWKPGLRIYEMTDLTVELREEGAPPW